MPKSTLALGMALVVGAQLSAYAQKAPSSARDLASSCAICHTTNGAATPAAGAPPALAGESAESLAQHLREFRDGKRPATIMQQIAKGYSDHQIDALAAYFAAQKKK